jgi:hypothetical protein
MQFFASNGSANGQFQTEYELVSTSDSSGSSMYFEHPLLLILHIGMGFLHRPLFWIAVIAS